MANILQNYIRQITTGYHSTGLEQELNKQPLSGTLAVPKAAARARAMAADGIVLLKNEDQILPIREEDTVAVFGRSAVNYFTVGFGSGGDVIPPYSISLMDGLKEAEVHYDTELAGKYALWCSENVPEEGTWGHWPMSNPEMPLKDSDVRAAAARCNKALVVIGRAAGEARENTLKKGSYYLTDSELRLLKQVTAAFINVCVILDCGNVIDMSWTETFRNRVGAIICAWQGGMESGRALTDILTGAVTPSGKLTDTIARRYEDYPSAGNFGGKDYNNYVEDIYVGYRYFQTFCPEKVLFPFGFGLSYTTFRVTGTATVLNSFVTVKATVENTGDVPGREVVQVYMDPPCGALGSPARILTGFAKSELLGPGESQELTISFSMKDFAPYDDSGITGNKSCTVLEAGMYTIELGTSIRDVSPILRIRKQQPAVVRRLRETLAPRQSFRRMLNRCGRIAWEDVPTETRDLEQQILEALPEPLAAPAEEVTFDDVLAGKNTAEEFVAQLTDQELDDITHGYGPMNDPHGIYGNAGGLGGVTQRLQERGLPAIVTTDGPSGIRVKQTCALLPCGTALASTFDPEGVQKLYKQIGKEMGHRSSDILLAPGMNIHRDPLCGRNFEYYSEDPLLTGKIAAAAVRGIQSQGGSACPKHFACNNQETNRHRNDSRVSERALRDIYLKGFEIMVRESSPKCIMTSYNKVNGVYSHYNYELATAILRQEWGFDGMVITDWWMQEDASREFPNITNDAFRIRAQVDVLMPGQIKNRTLLRSLQDPMGVSRAEAQRCALNVVNFIVKLKKDSE